jgi:alkylation response protein AidB-like acyl-CoA dehydrogenase
MGHGSDLKALETTAVYEEQTKSWLINSPTTTSTKFLIGLLGHYATHVLLMAKTYVKGKFIGLHGFIVEIRDRYFCCNVASYNQRKALRRSMRDPKWALIWWTTAV